MFKGFKGKKQKKPDCENKEMEELLRLMKELESGKKILADKSKLENGELAAAWNSMVNALFRDKRNKMLEVNKILENITEMTYVEDMIKEVRTQNDAIHTITASSEEMSASIDDVSGRTQSVAALVSDTLGITTKSNEDMKNAFSFVQKSFKTVKAISSDMNVLIEGMKQIDQIVDIIKGIADQTNLLALNAAIEAARAGEQGKGFSVVASEVRKLAEDTKSSIGSIQNSIENLRGELRKTVSDTSKTAEELETGTTLVNQVIEANQKVVEAIEQLNNEAAQIAANTQEQTAVTEEFTGKATELSQSEDKVLEACNETGQGIFEISQLNYKVRLNMINDTSSLEISDILDLCKTDHLNLRWRIYNMLLGYETVDADAAGNYAECRLGKWIAGEGKATFKDNAIFMKLEQPHMQMHEWSKKAVSAVASNDILTAKEAFKEMNLYTDKLFEILDELKQYTLSNNL